MPKKILISEVVRQGEAAIQLLETKIKGLEKDQRKLAKAYKAGGESDQEIFEAMVMAKGIEDDLTMDLNVLKDAVFAAELWQVQQGAAVTAINRTRRRYPKKFSALLRKN